MERSGKNRLDWNVGVKNFSWKVGGKNWRSR